jgi:NDP-sugar pyrophosphorylase family protein
MKAMVFAAGLGQRLQPLTDDLPKALVPVAGRPMIEYALRLLKHHGIEEIVINLHHLGEKIEAHLGSGEKLGLKIRYSKEERLLDTGGGLLLARPFLGRETFAVMNSDVLIDVDLAAVIARHREKRATATLVLRPDPRADQYGAIECSSDARIHRFLGRELPAAKTPDLRKLMFTGVQILEPKVFDFMDCKEPFSLTQTTYARMVSEGEALYGYTFEGYWQDLGTFAAIRDAEAKLTRGELKLSYL